MTGLQAELEAAFRKLPMDLGPDRQMLEGIVENTVAVEVHFTAVGGFDKSIPLAGHKFRYMAMVFRFMRLAWPRISRAASLIWRCAAANASLIATMTCSCSGASP